MLWLLTFRRIRKRAVWCEDPAVYASCDGLAQVAARAGGARIIYCNQLKNGEIWLLTIYAKGDRATLPAHELRIIKETIDDD